jgi:hypothetical protein
LCGDVNKRKLDSVEALVEVCMKGVSLARGILSISLEKKKRIKSHVSGRDTKYLNGMRIEVERETERESRCWQYDGRVT